DVVKTPAPAALEGYWQSKCPQPKLVSPEAIASLVETKEGDTLGCRQWHRIIALPGMLTLLSDHITNVTVE
ncbi:lipoprotein YedD, partial [Salmonella enterica]